MTQEKAELEELQALQKKSQKLRENREKPAPDVASKPKVGAEKIPAPDADGQDSHDSVSNLKENVTALAGDMESLFYDLEEAATEHPKLALLAAFGIGIFVGQLLSRR